MTSFSKEDVRRRIERFTSFLQRHHFSFRPPELGRRDLFYIYHEQELARVLIGRYGNIIITGRPGKLKDVLLTWIAQELPSYTDHSNPHDLEELDTYRYLLTPSSEPASLVRPTELPSGALRLPTECSQLVERLCCKKLKEDKDEHEVALFVQFKQPLRTAWQPVRLALSHLLCPLLALAPSAAYS